MFVPLNYRIQIKTKLDGIGNKLKFRNIKVFHTI